MDKFSYEATRDWISCTDHTRQQQLTTALTNLSNTIQGVTEEEILHVNNFLVLARILQLIWDKFQSMACTATHKIRKSTVQCQAAAFRGGQKQKPYCLGSSSH